MVLEAGGTISASQGCGLARTQFLPRQYGELVQVFREIKDAFDPSNLSQSRQGHRRRSAPDGRRSEAVSELAALAAESELGSLAGLGSGTGSGWVRVPETPVTESTPARSGSSSPTAAWSWNTDTGGSVILPVLRWEGTSALAMASACHGCGECRSLDPTLRMCPSYRAHRREAASPRSQANLIRQIATGQVDPKLWGAEEFKAHADLCIHCKLCKPECPSGRGRLEPDDRGQGSLRREPWTAAGRLGFFAAGDVGAAWPAGSRSSPIS